MAAISWNVLWVGVGWARAGAVLGRMLGAGSGLPLPLPLPGADQPDGPDGRR